VGLFILGNASDTSIVADNIFQFLGTDIIAEDTGVNITRNHFRESGTGILIRLPAAPKDSIGQAVNGVGVPLLGDVTIPDSGENTFRNIEGMAVENLTDEVVKAEKNDWGVYTEGEIAAEVTNVEFGEFKIAPLLGFLTGICSDAATGDGIAGAEVEISGHMTRVFTTDGDGRYLSVELNEGLYSCIADASGFVGSDPVEAEAFPGQTVEVDFALAKAPDGGGEGEGEGETQPPCPLSSLVGKTDRVNPLGRIRAFRDSRLLSNSIGSSASRTYYLVRQ
jgi:hypothetical protein